MQKRDLATWDWIAILTIGCFAFLAVVYTAFGGQIFGRIFRSEAAAAWVQALGSIAAIAAAVALARRDALERRRLAAIDAFVVASRIRESVRKVMHSTSGLMSTFNIQSKTLEDYYAKTNVMRERIDAMPVIPAADVAALARASGITAANLGTALDLIAILRSRFVEVSDLRPTQVTMAFGSTVRRELDQAYECLKLASAEIDTIARNPPPA